MSEIEKQFFDAFGIEPNIDYFVSFTNHKTKIVRCFHFNKEELLYRYKNTKDKMKVLRVDFDYPQITDRILLELVTLHSYWCMPRLCCFNVEQLKQQVLSDLSIFNDKRIELIHQVQALFKEGN